MMARYFHNIVQDRGGIVAVEFALMAPLIMIMTVGIINYAELTNYQMNIDRAVRNATNVAVVSPPINQDFSEIHAAFNYSAPAASGTNRTLSVSKFCECSDGLIIACSSDCASGDRQVFIEVHVSEDYEFLVPIPTFGNQLTITKSAIVRVS